MYIESKRGFPALKRRGRSPNYRFWTVEEIQILRKFYSTVSIDELCDKLSRSASSIWMKAAKLGIRTNRVTRRRNSWPFIRGNPYRNLLDTEVAYIAGIIDGEGCLTVCSTGHWRLDVINTFEPLVNWLREKIPYSTIRMHSFRQGNHKETFEWGLCDNLKIKALLDLLLPYLNVKREKAREAIMAIQKREASFLNFEQVAFR